MNLERVRREGEKKISKVSDNIESLKRRNEELAEEIIDLQGRSMRDNLIFFGFEECRTFDERMNENCIDKILSFCEKELNLENVRNSVKLERAHRIGKFTTAKNRPFVVKFNSYQDKLSVKKRAFDQLKDSQFRVSEQFPKVIQERRKTLIPHLIKAKQEGKKAVLSYDKLYIDNQLFKPTNVQVNRLKNSCHSFYGISKA